MRKMERDAYQKKLDGEIMRRIVELESADYSFPQRFGKGDWWLWGGVVLACFVMLLVGARM